RIRSYQFADPRQPARFRRRHADGGVLARVTHGIAQAIEAVALQNAHVAARMIGPDRCRAGALGDGAEAFGDFCERRIPGHTLELPAAFGPAPPLRGEQALRVLDALAVARHFGAHHTLGIGVGLRAGDAADAAVGQHANLKRAGAGTVVRTG